MNNRELTVLTWNIYLGGDHAPLLGTTPEEVPARMSKLWRQAQGTFFPSRARAMAAMIARARPDVIGLQEVTRWSVDARPKLGVPLPVVVYDFIPILLGELAALGAFYSLAARSPGVDVLLPTEEGFDVRLEDALAILVRTPAPGERLTWANPRAERFVSSIPTQIGGQKLTLSRQWTSVDISLGGRSARFVNVHIEFANEAVRDAQCAEVLAGPVEPRKRPVILLGDFNAKAEESVPWKSFAAAGFSDAFSQAGSGPGATWGQAGDLRNPPGRLTDRLDWVLYRGKAQAISATVLGADPNDRTPDGLWPSDHAGVLARLRLE